MNAIKVIGGVEISRISEQMASGTLVAAAVSGGWSGYRAATQRHVAGKAYFQSAFLHSLSADPAPYQSSQSHGFRPFNKGPRQLWYERQVKTHKASPITPEQVEISTLKITIH